MEAKVRKTSIDVVGNVPWGTHFCQFYQTKEDLIDMLVPYFNAGLENNEFCIRVTSEALTAPPPPVMVVGTLSNTKKVLAALRLNGGE